MTVSTTVAAHREAGNGVKTVWSAPFPVGAADRLHVETEAPDGTRTVRTPTNIIVAATTTGFTLTSPAVPDGHICVMERRTPLTQARRLPDLAIQAGRSIEAGLDEATMRDQELARGIARSLSVVNDGSALGLIPHVAARAGGLLGFDDAGSPAIFVATAGMQPASQAEAEAGVNNAKPMTALRTFQAIQQATDTLDVRHFSPATNGGFSGVSATGSVSDTAFQDALTALAVDGGGVLRIPSEGHSYRITQNLALGNGAAGVQSTWPTITIAGYDAVSGFGLNNPSGGGALILDGASIKAPGPQSGGSLCDLFIITPGDYPAGQWAVDLYEVSYGRFEDLNFSIYAGNGMRFTGYGDNGGLFNSAGRLLFRLDTGVSAAGSKAFELTQVGTNYDTASSVFDFIGVLPGRPDQVAVTLANCDTCYFDYVEVYPVPTPASTAVGATTNAAGYAAGVSTVTLANAGAGMLVSGDCFQFANHTTTYRLTSGDADVSNGGVISFAPALTNALPASAQAITVLKSAVALRLDYTADADYPQSITIDHLDCFNGRIESIGTPTQLAKNNPNVISYLNQQGGTPIPSGVSGLVVNRRRLKEGVLYVNASTGHDTLAAGLVDYGALKTIQRAYDLAALYYDLEGDLTIKLADGTHSVGLLANIRALGKKVTIQGNSASPGSVVLNVAGDAIVADGCHIVVRDVLITASGHALRAVNGGRIEYTNVVFASTGGAHAYADGGLIEQIGACFIIVGAAQHIRAANSGRVKSAFATTMLANVTFTDFARSETSGLIDCASATYPLNGNTVTGRRFNALDGDPVGAPSADFPGTVAGYANRRVRVLAQSAVQVASTEVTTEEVLATISIPAGALGLNGRLRIQAEGAMTNNANNKTLRVRLGGISGAVIGTLVFTTNDAWHLEAFVQNRNSASAQRAQAWGRREGDTVVKAWSNGVTAAVDTTAAVDLVITSQKATAGDAFTLESRLVELLP